MTDDSIRLDKFLAARGVASRRTSADYVRAGRVTVNGEPAESPGQRVNPDADQIAFDSKQVSSAPEHLVTIALNKPRGYVCTTNARQGRTVYELIPDMPERLVPVGRLDKESEGLLLMSNDGDLILRLTHPRFGHEKVYEVTVTGRVTLQVLTKLRSRLVIDGYRIQPVEVRELKRRTRDSARVLEFRLREGRNRQIRKMCAAAGLDITRLVRRQIQSITLEGLEPGQSRRLMETELASLASQASEGSSPGLSVEGIDGIGLIE